MNRSGKNKNQTPTALIHLVKTDDNQEPNKKPPQITKNQDPQISKLGFQETLTYKIKNHQNRWEKQRFNPRPLRKQPQSTPIASQ